MDHFIMMNLAPKLYDLKNNSKAPNTDSTNSTPFMLMMALNGTLNSFSSNNNNNFTENTSNLMPAMAETPLASNVPQRRHVMRNLPRTKGSIKKRLRPQNVPRSNVERRRRVRCHKCESCTKDDCGECKYCKDMKKFGGTGISKQCCLNKQCTRSLLPRTTTCMLCNALIDRDNRDPINIMYECEICFEIYHTLCFRVGFY